MATHTYASVTSSSNPLFLFNNGSNNALALNKAMWEFIQKHPLLKKHFWCGRGKDVGSSVEHSSGNATDWMVSPSVGVRPSSEAYKAGMELLTVLLNTSATRNMIKHVIFSIDGVVSYIYNPSKDVKWRKLGNRGSVSANHIDHFHILVKPGVNLPPGFVLTGNISTLAGGPSKPTAPPTAPPSKPSGALPTVSVKAVRYSATVDPDRAGTATTNPANVMRVEKALNALGYLDTKYVDGHAGTEFIKSYQQFQRDLGYTGSDADGIPGVASLTVLGTRTRLFRVVA